MGYVLNGQSYSSWACCFEDFLKDHNHVSHLKNPPRMATDPTVTWEAIDSAIVTWILQIMKTNMRKIMVLENASSRIKNYTQLFESHLKILNSDESRSNLQGGGLKIKMKDYFSIKKAK